MVEITEEKFRELYLSLTIKQLAEKLCVKPNQVQKQAKLLGLSKPRGVRPKQKLIIR